MSVFQTLSLMLLFAMFILALLTYIDRRNNKKAALRNFGQLQGSLMLSY
ncbi:hypothetical protein N624_0013 [Levilactobacillus brevis]|nr:hypothetical protein N624_0013 [Levilactobacillus brevis]